MSGLTVIDTARVESMIPHRPPFLLVDAIDSLEPGKSCGSRWRIDPEEPILAGHFPGNPIVPGVLLIEHAAQTACIMIGPANAGPNSSLPMLAKIESCRFMGVVRPGDVVRTTVTFERTLGNFTLCRTKSTVGGRRVVDCQMVVALSHASDLAGA